MIRNNEIYVIYLVCVIFAAVMGWFLTDTKSKWYMDLKKPSFQPSPIVFSIVWPILFLALSFAGWLGNNATKNDGQLIAWNVLFATTIVLSVLWPFVFFNQHDVYGGFFLVLTFIVVVVFMIIMMFTLEYGVALILIPLLCWLIIAAILSWSYVSSVAN